MKAPNFKNMQKLSAEVPAEAAGARLDKFLATHWADYSRTLLATLVREGGVSIEGIKPAKVKPALKLEGGERISIELPAIEEMDLEPEDIPLNIIFEDDAIIVINKQAALSCHPPRTGKGGTLANALLFHFNQLSGKGSVRPGIVHRLDADTTGVIVCAKDDSAHFKLSRQFEQREVKKEYLAIVRGVVKLNRDVIDKRIERDPNNREMMRIGSEGRAAVTEYEVIERFKAFTYVRCMPRTGRTHQIRVHLACIGYPVISDRLYSKRNFLTRSEIMGTLAAPGEAPLIARQALHAARLSFTHPITGLPVSFEVPPPEDFATTLEALRGHEVAAPMPVSAPVVEEPVEDDE
jgi:23S rRNA pseudouridine1911/1915/1917 synthase